MGQSKGAEVAAACASLMPEVIEVAVTNSHNVAFPFGIPLKYKGQIFPPVPLNFLKTPIKIHKGQFFLNFIYKCDRKGPSADGKEPGGLTLSSRCPIIRLGTLVDHSCRGMGIGDESLSEK